MRFGLIGEHLSHSHSPELHSLLGNDDYTLMEVRPDELGSFLKKGDFKGINVTIPYKSAVIPYLDYLSPEAQLTGAVNTIVRKEGRLCGYNTDCFGFIAMVKSGGLDLKGMDVLILGAGGAAGAVREALRRLEAGTVRNAARRPSADTVPIESAGGDNFQAIVNATPVGMYPSVSDAPADINKFKGLRCVLDCIYNPLRSRLVIEAASCGIVAQGGLKMLVAQAVKAHELFTGESLPAISIESVYRKLLEKQENIVLCGMPSCGKSTIGSLIAKRLNREWIDTDSLIEEQSGRSVKELFAQDGEQGFRKAERDAIASIAHKQGCVISLGGGAVMDDENVRNLKMNGRIVLLDRPLELLVADSCRPLASDRESLSSLYGSRISRYREVAQITAANDGAPAECADNILKLMYNR